MGTLERIAAELEAAAAGEPQVEYVVWIETRDRNKTHGEPGGAPGPCADYELGSGASFENAEDAAWSLLASPEVDCLPNEWRHMVFPVVDVPERGRVPPGEASPLVVQPPYLSTLTELPEFWPRIVYAELLFFAWDKSERSGCLKSHAAMPSMLRLSLD